MQLYTVVEGKAVAERILACLKPKVSPVRLGIYTFQRAHQIRLTTETSTLVAIAALKIASEVGKGCQGGPKFCHKALSDQVPG